MATHSSGSKHINALMAMSERAARKRGQSVSTSHMLLVMTQSSDPVHAVLAKAGVTEEALLAWIAGQTSRVDEARQAEHALGCKHVLERAVRLAQQIRGSDRGAATEPSRVTHAGRARKSELASTPRSTNDRIAAQTSAASLGDGAASTRSDRGHLSVTDRGDPTLGDGDAETVPNVSLAHVALALLKSGHSDAGRFLATTVAPTFPMESELLTLCGVPHDSALRSDASRRTASSKSASKTSTAQRLGSTQRATTPSHATLDFGPALPPLSSAHWRNPHIRDPRMPNASTDRPMDMRSAAAGRDNLANQGRDDSRHAPSPKHGPSNFAQPSEARSPLASAGEKHAAQRERLRQGALRQEAEGHEAGAGGQDKRRALEGFTSFDTTISETTAKTEASESERMRRGPKPPANLRRAPKLRKQELAPASHDPAEPRSRDEQTLQHAVVAHEPGALSADAYPFLSRFGRNLNVEALRGRIDPLVGRAAEMNALLDVLGKRRANNPLLVGPPGVGKTALVEGVARHMALTLGASHPEHRTVVELSMADLLAGTAMRGALSQRVQALLNEIEQGSERIVVFIDEIHGLLMAPDTAEDLAGQLKSSLARGAFPCIGATTEAEFRTHLEKDPAFLRRFSRIDVAEPSPEDTRHIIEGLRPRYEKHHGLRFEDDAIAHAVFLTHQHLKERLLPEKALTVLDTAGARARRRGLARVAKELIVEVVSEICRIPAARLLRGDAASLERLPVILHEDIVGHEAARDAITGMLQLAMSVAKHNRPIANLLLLGPTGVGKTAMAKSLARALFPGGDMVRVDMSTMGESHAVARLIGAPPGYVGYDGGGQLTEAIRRNPHQLILLDEVEKAHPSVWLSLLSLLDEGYLRDSQGRKVDFSQTLVCMTSNLGAEHFARPRTLGFAQAGGVEREVGCHGRDDIDPSAKKTQEAVLAEARSALPPELWNRIDETVVLFPLRPEDRVAIAHKLVEQRVRDIKQHQGVDLRVSAQVFKQLAEASDEESLLGARAVARKVRDLFDIPFSQAWTKGLLPKGSRQRVAWDDELTAVRFEAYLPSALKPKDAGPGLKGTGQKGKPKGSKRTRLDGSASRLAR